MISSMVRFGKEPTMLAFIDSLEIFEAAVTLAGSGQWLRQQRRVVVASM